MSPDAFVAELERLSTDVAGGRHGEVPNVRMPSMWVIETGEQRFEMPAGWLRTEIETARRQPAQWPAKRSAILARLDALKFEAHGLVVRLRSDPAGDRTASRDALSDVLAGPEFRQMQQQSAVSRLWEQISEMLLRAWHRLGGQRLGSRGTAILFAWLTVLVALGVLSAWLARLLLRPDRLRGPAAGAPAARVRSARAWAHDALTAPDPREATRCAYRAAVRGLEEEGAWRADPARTPREYLRLLPSDHRRRVLLSDVARRFEEIWFGARAATEDDRRAVLAWLKELGCLPAE
jgi:hypothetical protein